MKLTTEQLKQNAAAMLAFADGKPIQFIPVHKVTWEDYIHLDILPDLTNRPFRPKPQLVSRPWSKPEDVPLNCWLRKLDSDNMHLVTTVFSIGLWFHFLGRLAWDEMTEYQYSTDRVTWKPCTVED